MISNLWFARLHSTSVFQALSLLSSRDRWHFLLVIILQLTLAFLDLIGVILIGVVALLALGTLGGSSRWASVVLTFSSEIGGEDWSQSQVILTLAGVAGFLLMSKSLLSLYLMRRTLHFLAQRQSGVSRRLIDAILARPLIELAHFNSEEIVYALVIGVPAATVGLLGAFTILLSEGFILVVLASLVVFVDPWLGLLTFSFFGGIALFLHRVASGWAKSTGDRIGVSMREASLGLRESLASFREVTVFSRQNYVAERINRHLGINATGRADTLMIQQLPKFVFELALVLGGALLVAFQSATTGLTSAVAILAVFVTATVRAMPSILRMQGAAFSMRVASGEAAPTFRMAKVFLTGSNSAPMDLPTSLELASSIAAGYKGFAPHVLVNEVSFEYPGNSDWALDQVSLRVPEGSVLALVGESGAGKSSLADVVLGLLEPSLGSVSISGCTPRECFFRWPGAIAYVPQDVVPITGSIRQNVALGLPRELIDDGRVWHALALAQLDHFVKTSLGSLDANVGERGAVLSGGQRQRLGLARALYSSPKLIVLDEATSSLDAETENDVSTALFSLRPNVTQIIIAHRLSTIRQASAIAFMRAGRIVDTGSFEELRYRLPDFDRYVSLMSIGRQA